MDILLFLVQVKNELVSFKLILNSLTWLDRGNISSLPQEVKCQKVTLVDNLLYPHCAPKRLLACVNAGVEEFILVISNFSDIQSRLLVTIDPSLGSCPLLCPTIFLCWGISINFCKASKRTCVQDKSAFKINTLFLHFSRFHSIRSILLQLLLQEILTSIVVITFRWSSVYDCN